LDLQLLSELAFSIGHDDIFLDSSLVGRLWAGMLIENKSSLYHGSTGNERLVENA
jgi:hypothetical protein